MGRLIVGRLIVTCVETDSGEADCEEGCWGRERLIVGRVNGNLAVLILQPSSVLNYILHKTLLP